MSKIKIANKNMERKQRYILVLSITLYSAFLIFSTLNKKVNKLFPFQKPTDPYRNSKNVIFLKNELGQYGKLVWYTDKDQIFVNRHPANSPGFFYRIFDFLPYQKEDDEFRIVFFGNSQLFQVPEGDRIPLPAKIEQYLKNYGNKKIKVLNLSCFGMNVSETLINLIKAKDLNADLVIIAYSPRDFVNEEKKTLGITSEYAKPLLSPPILKTILANHLLLLKDNDLWLVINSFAQFLKVWQRELNLLIEEKIKLVWPTYMSKSLVYSKTQESLFRNTKISTKLAEIEKLDTVSPSSKNPYFESGIYPNVRSLQMEILINSIGYSKIPVIVYNEPIRPKTFNLYFREKNYQEKVAYVKNLCDKSGFKFIDFNKKLNDNQFADWIHLSPAGVDFLSRQLIKEIETIIKNGN